MRLDQLKPRGAIKAAQSSPLAVYLVSHATSSGCTVAGTQAEQVELERTALDMGTTTGAGQRNGSGAVSSSSDTQLV
jgi:hypothetical protein